MSALPPLVEGAYYEREDGSIGRATILYGFAHVCGDAYKLDGARVFARPRLIRRVWPVHTDPAEVVNELHEAARVTRDQLGGNNETADIVSECLQQAADIVAEKLLTPSKDSDGRTA